MGDDGGELREYFVISKIVTDFDNRLLTIKGWGVTLSLVALGLGFQLRSYGKFLVAAVSSLTLSNPESPWLTLPARSMASH